MHRASAALILALVVSAGALAPVASAAADSAGWSIGPTAAADGGTRANFDYAVDPGTSVTDAITVRNDGATALALRIYPADAFTTREGNIDVLTSGTASADAGTWIALGTSTLTLDPGEAQSVPFTVTVPADARPGDHPAGIVTSLVTDDAAAQVQVDRRLGSRMQIRVSGELVPAVEVSDPQVSFSGSWNPLAVGFVSVGYTLQNTGNTRVTAIADAVVAGPFGIVPVNSAPVQLPEVLPGSTIDVSERLDGIGALLWLTGAVQVQPSSVGFGAATLDPVRAEFTVPAVPFAALLILLAVAGVAVVVLLLARRRAASTSPVDPRQ
ncbi:DUF916 domain-containing protein [Microbacteriaceae bacterium VKM Ac-2854]|nr:DUF916 domain-containing protein [Microbacteriaceae bacterium VKM Ac-2854]